MPKIKKPPPPGVLDHLIRRYREGRITADDFLELKHWLESDPTVPPGRWYKRFKAFTLAGNGEMPSTLLTPGMAVKGEEVQGCTTPKLQAQRGVLFFCLVLRLLTP